MSIAVQSPENLLTRLFLSKSSDRLTQPAVRAGRHVLIYEELLDRIQSTAQTLHTLGVHKGDRVGLYLGNTPEYVVAFFAVTALGAVAVPLGGQTGAEQLRFILQDTAPKLCLHKGDVFAADGQSTPFLGMELDWETTEVRLLIDGRAPTRPERPFCCDSAGEEDAAVILYSAGSTGRPKGVVLKHRHLLAVATALSKIIGMGPDHRDLIVNPLTHSGGWQRVSSTFLAGGCIVFPQGFLSVPTLIDEIESHGITGFFTTPPIIRMMLSTKPEKFGSRVSSCRSIEIASAPLTPAELSQLMQLFPGAKVFYQYGSTECSRALILDARSHPDKLHTIGRPTRGVEVAILGESGSFLGPNQEGEIVVRAPQRTDQFWGQPELARERMQDGFLLTGDIGSVDEAGFVTLLGRKDDMINCGGLSFFPAEVEAELGKIDGVASYLVAGVPDPEKLMNQVPWIFVVPEDPASWSPRAFDARARRTLPSHMVPRNVVVIDELPMAAGTKPCRRLAVERYGPR